MTTTEAPRLTFTPSRQFPNWLAEREASIGFTTYQAGKLFLIGVTEDGQITFFERTINRCMGLHMSRDALWVASIYQIWRFDNTLQLAERYKDNDALFSPRVGYVTGDVDVHDVCVDENGRPVFVNTLFSCLATVSQTASFVPIWTPPFISRLAAEDRCHLNGLALKDGKPAYVTAVAESDVAEGWREHRRDGGIVLSVESNEVIANGLSMPHSPRWHDGCLWIVQAGTGEFGRIDLASGKFEPICFLPGFARGLAFLDGYAVVTLSRLRETRTFHGLALEERLASHGISARCGLAVIDLKTGDLVHSLTIDGIVEELYDVAVLPGIRRPALVGFQSDEIHRILKIGDPKVDL